MNCLFLSLLLIEYSFAFRMPGFDSNQLNQGGQQIPFSANQQMGGGSPNQPPPPGQMIQNGNWGFGQGMGINPNQPVIIQPWNPNGNQGNGMNGNQGNGWNENGQGNGQGNGRGGMDGQNGQTWPNGQGENGGNGENGQNGQGENGETDQSGNLEKNVFGNSLSILPDFVLQAPLEARQSFAQIIQQKNQTLSQLQSALANWAQQNNFTSQYEAYVAQEANSTQLLQNHVTTTLVEMQLIFGNLFSLQKNTSATIDYIVTTIDSTLKSLSRDKRILLAQILRVANGDSLSPLNPQNNGGIVPPPPGPNNGDQNSQNGQNPNGQVPFWQPNNNFGVNVLHVS